MTPAEARVAVLVALAGGPKRTLEELVEAAEVLLEYLEPAFPGLAAQAGPSRPTSPRAARTAAAGPVARREPAPAHTGAQNGSGEIPRDPRGRVDWRTLVAEALELRVGFRVPFVTIDSARSQTAILRRRHAGEAVAFRVEAVGNGDAVLVVAAA